jgi:hypothetical protein
MLLATGIVKKIARLHNNTHSQAFKFHASNVFLLSISTPGNLVF